MTTPDARPGERRIRIGDVAALAGVSSTTVSHALSGIRTVKAATRERVLQAAAELDYAPDRRASGLRSRRSGVIGFVSDVISTTPFAGDVIVGAHEAAAERDTVTMIVDSGGDTHVEAMQIKTLLDFRVDGILYARMFHTVVAQPSVPSDVPMVLVNAIDPGHVADSITPDEQQIAAIAMAHLVERGHRIIGFATTTEDTPASRGRERGWRDALQVIGVDADPLVHRASSDALGGRECGAALLAQTPRPTAVFCFNDQIAMGVYQAAAGLGLDVPTDVSVVGVDDLAIVAAALDPPLTTVALPHAEMGRWAMRRLLERIDGDRTQRQARQIACSLVERQSVASVIG
ncbi:LacI family DNA-binding transcriptional regulator [Agreia sp. COWG]|uniref:LacI family DNA-binding transcriptional regulator n=1 Tax=Agreia sp. COWG TaxID=2773266 RepID=UPI001929449A|nr:LacI family DNA-binding transcriptional regulator [Agreia sp. COWG]CAD6005129.1 LacI family transcriptional regulator [Agreia sp. COWG]